MECEKRLFGATMATWAICDGLLLIEVTDFELEYTEVGIPEFVWTVRWLTN